MSTFRCIFAVAAGAAFGVAASFLILRLGPREAGLWLAISAAFVVLWGLAKYLEHVSRASMRAYREQVWQRRETQRSRRTHP